MNYVPSLIDIETELPAHRLAAYRRFRDPVTLPPPAWHIAACYAYENASVEKRENGAWVPAWIWVPNEEAVKERLRETD